VLSLIVPDRRYTFDILRRESTLAEAIDCHMQRLRRPTFRQVFDYFSSGVGVDARALWAGTVDIKALVPEKDLHAALELCKRARDEYIDSHCWVFTTDSSRRLLADFKELQLTDFVLTRFFETDPTVSNSL
jgi:hypothetical protein